MKLLKKIIICLFIGFNIIIMSYADKIEEIDNLYHDGKYVEGLNNLLKMFDKSNPDAAIIWRISRMYYEIADAMPNNNKKEKINKFNDGMKICENYLEMKTGDKTDRAQVVFWYTANLGSRGETIGIKESLDTVPRLFELADKAIAIDPTFAAPYLLKGRIDDAVPSFLGGDKFRMGINFSKAIKLDPKELSVLVDSGNGFIKRGWDVNKKKDLARKYNKTDGTPEDLSDKQYAKQILTEAIRIYYTIKNPSLRDKNNYEKATKLLKKVS